MSRLFLVVALALSLWPAAFLIWTFSTEESTSSADEGADVSEATTDPDPYIDDAPDVRAEPEFPRPDCRRLKQLTRASHRLNQRFDDVQLTAGVAVPEVADPGQKLVARYERWLERNSGTYQAVLDYARRDRRVIATMTAVAQAPDEAKLRTFNQAVRRFNRNPLDSC